MNYQAIVSQGEEMRAVYFDQTLRYVADCPRPEPRQGEALIRVTGCGICNTDLEIVKGYGGFVGIPGHEFCGVVESTGPLQGKRVVGEINLACRSCASCRQGLANHCPDRRVLGIVGKDGALADYLTLPDVNLHAVPDSVPDREAIFVEPLAAALEILAQVRIEPEAEVLVMGDGKLGLLCGLALNLHCRKVTLAGKHVDKMAIVARQGLRTVHTDAVRPGFDLVVEATGSGSGLAEALNLVRPRGTVVLKTTTAAPASLNLSPLVVNEITVVGSRCGPFAPALDLLAHKRIAVGPLLSASYPMEQALAAFERAGQPGTLKVFVDLGLSG